MQIQNSFFSIFRIRILWEPIVPLARVRVTICLAEAGCLLSIAARKASFGVNTILTDKLTVFNIFSFISPQIRVLSEAGLAYCNSSSCFAGEKRKGWENENFEFNFNPDVVPDRHQYS